MARSLVRIVHGLARSGSTLLARCLGCMKDVVLLSEIHPQMRYLHDPVRQAREWHGIEASGRDFAGAIASIEEGARAAGRHLVVRGWEHVDYVGMPYQQPSFRPSLLDSLSSRFEIYRVALTRQGDPQWRSMCRHPLLRRSIASGKYALPQFLAARERYCEMISGVPTLDYENLVADPVRALRFVCDALALPRDDSFVDKWHAYEHVTGDERGINRIELRPALDELEEIAGR